MLFVIFQIVGRNINCANYHNTSTPCVYEHVSYVDASIQPEAPLSLNSTSQSAVVDSCELSCVQLPFEFMSYLKDIYIFFKESYGYWPTTARFENYALGAALKREQAPTRAGEENLYMQPTSFSLHKSSKITSLFNLQSSCCCLGSLACDPA